MKTLNASQPSYAGSSAPRFEAAKALAFSIAQSGNEFIEPEFIAWVDRSTAMFSPETGCFGPNGGRDYRASHK